jgi:hypothetical protein
VAGEVDDGVIGVAEGVGNGGESKIATNVGNESDTEGAKICATRALWEFTNVEVISKCKVNGVPCGVDGGDGDTADANDEIVNGIVE